MKSAIRIFVVGIAVAIIIATVSWVATTPPAELIQQSSMAVEVPSEVNTAIGIGIAAMMTAGLLFIFTKTGLDLRMYAAPVALTISTFVTAELQSVINVIPMTYDPWINIGFKILVVLLGSVGTLFVIKGRSTSGDVTPRLV